VDHVFELESKFGTPNLQRCERLVNDEMMWVITEVVTETNVGRRAKIIKQFIKVSLKTLALLHNDKYNLI